MDDHPTQLTDATGRAVTSRRGVLRAAAWTTPAVVATTASPAFAASTVALQPHINPVGMQATLTQQMDAAIARAATWGITLPDYQDDGIPRCVGVDFSAYNIYFTAQRNGADANGEEMTFTLTGGLVFDAPESGTTATVQITNGRATPPKFRAPASGVTAPISVVATFASETSTLTLPLSGYTAVCALPGGPY